MATTLGPSVETNEQSQFKQNVAIQALFRAINTADTFVPVLSFGGATTGITYVTQTGNYTRIGSLVFVEILITLTSKGSATGTATITTLPFTPARSSPLTFQGNNLDAAVITAVQITVIAASTTLNPQKFAGGAATNLADTDFANNSILRIAGWYPV